jgi:hypothetical protein
MYADMQLQQITAGVFDELAGALQQLDPAQYVCKCRNLSGATIGQHVRHTIELYQCLLTGYETGVVNYEKRKRNLLIETDKNFALQLLQWIGANIGMENKEMTMEAAFGAGTALQVATNYYRELVYNLEHTIHHMALIRVGILEIADIVLPESFGVAPSTIQYRKTCAP